MKLISAEKINLQVEKYANRSSLDWLNFIDGAYFAEKELENLAIEFALFIGNLKLKLRFDRKLKVWKSENGNIYPTTVLFNKFIEIRAKP